MSASDSSEEEDLSRFKEVVDTSFSALKSENNNLKLNNKTSDDKKKSDRYLEDATHYNDVKYPKELQIKIGNKISTIIGKSFEFVEMEPKKFKRKIKGGIKLFSDSNDFLSCHEAEDRFTETHNIKAKKLKHQKQCADLDEEKIKSVAISGEFVLSKEEVKCWKSRRREKVFKYKSNGKGALIAIE